MSDSKPSNPKDALGIAKAPLSCVPVNVIAELGVALMEGALKYGRYNYREVDVRASVYFDAAIRHLFAWWEGEDIDPDSGMSHIVKAMASLTVLRDGMQQPGFTDDRPKFNTKLKYAELNKLAAALLEKYKRNVVESYLYDDASSIAPSPNSDASRCPGCRSTKAFCEAQKGIHQVSACCAVCTHGEASTP